MIKDSSELHKSVLIRVNTPVLDENNNLEKQLLKIDSERIINPIYEEAFDLKKLRNKYEKEYINGIGKYNFFDNYPMSETGGLKFNFKNLSKDDKNKSAEITARLNEKICSDNRRKKVYRVVNSFLHKMNRNGKKIIFYLKLMNQLRENYNNLEFLDLADSDIFNDNDFCDYEHLNKSGAVKLSNMLNDYIEKY